MELKLDEHIVESLIENIRALYAQAIEQARRDAFIDREFLTIPEALKYTNTSRNTFQSNFVAKGLPIYQVEGKTYVKKSEINAFIEKHKI